MPSKKKELPTESELTPVEADDLRKQMIDNGLPALIVDRLLELIDSTGPAWAFCPKCNRKVQVELPVWKYRVDAIKVALDHTVGKPTERKSIHLTGAFDDLAKLSDQDLERLLASEG